MLISLTRLRINTLVQIFHSKQQILTSWWHYRKSLGITIVIRIFCPGTMFHRIRVPSGEKLDDHQSLQDSSFGDHGCLHKISGQFIGSCLSNSWFRLDQNGFSNILSLLSIHRAMLLPWLGNIRLGVRKTGVSSEDTADFQVFSFHFFHSFFLQSFNFFCFCFSYNVINITDDRMWIKSELRNCLFCLF